MVVVSITPPFLLACIDLRGAELTAFASAKVSQGNTGKVADTRPKGDTHPSLLASPTPSDSIAFALRREVLDHLRIILSHTDLCRAARRSQLNKEIDVDLRVMAPLFGHVVFVIDRFDRADRFARPTVDAFVRVDVQHPGALVDAIDRALLNARLVFDVDTGFGYHVRHRRLLRVLFGVGCLFASPRHVQATFPDKAFGY